MSVNPQRTCADVREHAHAKIQSIEEKIESSAAMKAALGRLAASCRGSGPTSECPILEELDREDNADG